MSKAYIEMATDFLEMVAYGQIAAGYEKYVSSNFIHHNQYFKGDRESLMEAMIEDHKTNPNVSIMIKNVYQDKNSVITHSLVEKKDMKIAVVHIFRFEGSMIAELWDLGQVIDEESPNENGLF